MVRGKGGRERIVPLTDKAISAHNAYSCALAEEGGRDAHSDWLFPSRARQGYLTRQRFHARVKGTCT